MFRNEKDVLVHIDVAGEHIQTTLGHPFYVAGKGWVKAGELKAGNELILYDGRVVEIEKVRIEKCKPVTTYNFEVEDSHAYYVAESEVLCHNACVSGSAKNYSAHSSRNSAFRAAKRTAGIPVSQQPTQVIQSVTKAGKPIAGRTYIFGEGKSAVQIMEHAAGHAKGGIGPHFNIRGIDWHFLFPV